MVPCPQCNQGAAPGYSLCPHCGANLLVDVILDGPIQGSRERFEVAKSLMALGTLGLTFGELQEALQTPHPVVARGVTRAFAGVTLERLDASGVRGEVVPVGQGGQRGAVPRVPALWGAVALGVALVAGGGWFALRRTSGGQVPQVTAPAPTPDAETPAAAATPGGDIPRDVMERVIASSVVIKCPRSEGAGFFVSEQQVLTNAHVVCGAEEQMRVLLSNGRTVLGTTRRRDDALDLAVVDVAGASGEPLPLGDAAAVKPGEKVAAVGSPRGLEFTLSLGTVSYVGRNRFGVGYLQVDINVNPGNSGGPVVDRQGRALGLMTMMVKDSNGLGLALPVNYAVTGAAPVLALPQAPPASPAWTELLDRVAQANQREVDEARRSFAQPGLLTAALRQDAWVVAAVMRRSPGEPSVEPLTFRMEKGGQVLCPPASAPPQGWKRLNGTTLKGIDKQMLGWLRANRLDSDLYVGVAVLRWASCAPAVGAELVLEGSDAGASRTPVVPFSFDRFEEVPVPRDEPPQIVDPDGPEVRPPPAVSARPDTAAPDTAEQEALWRGRFQGARQKIKDVDARVEQAKAFIHAADGHATVGYKLTERGITKYEEAQQIVARADADRAQAQKELEDLEHRAANEAIPFEWRR